MQNWLAHSWILDFCLFAQEKRLTALERMDDKMRAKVLAALAAFIILGFGLIALAWVGARVTRRYMNQEPLRKRGLDELEDDWTSKPLVPRQPINSDADEDE